MDRTSFMDRRRHRYAFRPEALLPKSPTCGEFLGVPHEAAGRAPPKAHPQAAAFARNLGRQRRCGTQPRAVNFVRGRRSHTIQHPSFARIHHTRLSRYCHFRRTPAITPQAMLQTNGALGRIKPLIVISWHGMMPANTERLKHHGRIHLPDVSSA